MDTLLLATRSKATVLCTGVVLGPTMTWAENVPFAQGLELCANTTGNDWVDRSWSWHVVAFSTVPATVTTPPLAESVAGVAPAERTTGTGGGGAGLAHTLSAPSNPNRTSAAAKRGRTESLDQVIPFFTPARRPSSI